MTGSIDLDRIAARVQGCPAVAALHPGPFGEVATYLPGRRIAGVRLTEQHLEVHVTGRYPHATGEIGDQIRAAVAAEIGPDGPTVLVVIEDYVASSTTH